MALLQWATSNACSDVIEPEPVCEDILTGKSKQLKPWATSAACGADSGGGNGSCSCDSETANFADIACIGVNEYSCTNSSGSTITFKAKKCKKLSGKKAPDCAISGAAQKNQNINKNKNKNKKKKNGK